jgi:hypothetical protein
MNAPVNKAGNHRFFSYAPIVSFDTLCIAAAMNRNMLCAVPRHLAVSDLFPMGTAAVRRDTGGALK